MINTLRQRVNIDVVFCIDGTKSMAPCIESVKSNARRFHLEFVSAVADSGSRINSMRVKVIVFRDYKSDGKDAIKISPFYRLPLEIDKFVSYLDDILPFGGGDKPENGLEAIYYAMKSDFIKDINDRQLIVLFTDSDALALRDRLSEASYPVDMVDEEELISNFKNPIKNINYKEYSNNLRLVIFAPRGTKYESFSSKIDNSVFVPVDMAEGLTDINYTKIIKTLVSSTSK